MSCPLVLPLLRWSVCRGGRLVDRWGSSTVTFTGLIGVAVGSVLMTMLPGTFGVSGYVVSLAPIAAGYSLFQAANSTAIMNGAAKDRRGVTSALLALARNLGLVTGASAMGVLYAMGSDGVEMLNLTAGGEAGMRLTFIVAAAFAGLALVVAWWGLQSRIPAH